MLFTLLPAIQSSNIKQTDRILFALHYLFPYHGFHILKATEIKFTHVSSKLPLFSKIKRQQSQK